MEGGLRSWSLGFEVGYDKLLKRVVERFLNSNARGIVKGYD